MEQLNPRGNSKKKNKKAKQMLALKRGKKNNYQTPVKIQQLLYVPEKEDHE